MRATKRQVAYYSKDCPSVDISISVYGFDHLTLGELHKLGDHLADNAMFSIQGAPYLNAPLSRIQAKRKKV